MLINQSGDIQGCKFDFLLESAPDSDPPVIGLMRLAFLGISL